MAIDSIAVNSPYALNRRDNLLTNSFPVFPDGTEKVLCLQ